MTLFFLSHEITIFRLRPFGASIQAFSATFTAYQADIQPFDIERTNLAGGRIGTMYDCFMDSTVPVKEGDQVVVTDTNKRYSVKSVNHFEGASLLDHTHCVLVSRDG